MNRNQWKIIAIAGASMLALTACSPNGKHAAANKAFASNSSSAKAYGLKNQANFKLDASGKRINPLAAPANQTYYFAFDSASMRPQDLNALNVQANFLVSHPKAKIRLEGNTDNRGSREYNIALGWRRDQTVARFMEQQGVNPNQIKEVSYGKERPAVLGSNARAWSLNRRVNLVYTAE